MSSRFRRSRAYGALVALLASATFALGQFKSGALTFTAKDKETPSFPIAVSRIQPTLGLEVTPTPATPASATPAPAPSLRTRLAELPRLLTPARTKTEGSCEHFGPAPPTPEEIRRLQSGQATPVEVVAAKIKAEDEAAPARRAAINYLASVKCARFPEVEAALIAALRTDRNESVRHAAAVALASAGCGSIKITEALFLAASGSASDGNPPEVSERVRSAANQALQQFAARGCPMPHPDELPPATTNNADEVQLLRATPAPDAPALPPPSVTDAERHFAETAGSEAPAVGRPARASKLPAIHLKPIGSVPQN
jgi:hypothetical protein